MTEAWGAGALAMAVEAGIMGGALVLAVILLRPRSAWAAGLLLLGLVHFLVPPLVTVPLVRPTLIVELGAGAVGEGTSVFMAVLALAQWGGLAAGALVLLRSALVLRRTIGEAARVEAGPVHDALRREAREQGIPTPRLYLTRGGGPAATGVFRPAVLIPRETARSLDPGALRMVLAHEVAHLARRDTMVAPLRLLVVALWWFHPVAWPLARLHRQAAEDASDDRAAARSDRRAYCRALLAAAAAGPDAAPMATGLGGHPLGRRFRRLLEPGGAPRVGGPLLALIAFVFLAAAPLGLLVVETGRDGSGPGLVPNVVIHHEVVIRRDGGARRIMD